METTVKRVKVKQLMLQPIVRGRHTGPAPKREVNLNKRSHFDWVPVDSLLIDPEYQRSIERKRLNEMARNFNVELLGTLVVSLRANKLIYVIDGQHRHQLLQMLENPPEKVYCEIFEGLTIEEEANLFYLLDTKRKALTPKDAFKARLVSREPTALAIYGVADSLGLAVNAHRGSNPKNIQAVNEVEGIFKRQGPTGLTEILSVAHTAWPEDDFALSGKILRALESFLSRYGEFANYRYLIKTLQSVTPSQLMAKGRVIEGSLSLNIYDSLALAIFQMYNKGLRTNRLPEWEFSQEA